jgi:hypothetical protein
MLVSLFISCCVIHFPCSVSKSVVPPGLKRLDLESWLDLVAFYRTIATASATCNPSSRYSYLTNRERGAGGKIGVTVHHMYAATNALAPNYRDSASLISKGNARGKQAMRI